MNNLIGISGKINSGKDAVGKILKYLDYEQNVMGGRTQYGLDNFPIKSSNYQIKKYADKLKDIVCLLIGCTREQLEDREFKEKELGEEWWYYDLYKELYPYIKTKSENPDSWHERVKDRVVKLTPRKLLQLLGTDCGRYIIHPNIWVNALFADYKERVLTHEEEKRLLSIWKNINTRCNNPNYEKYNLYGGKGITNSWKTFDSFKGWAKSNGYTNDLTIDRVDRDLGYNPNNCRWVTPSLQAFNQGVYKNSKSGIRGVSIKSSRKDRNWVAQIQYKGKKDHLGYFKTKEEAEKAYLSKQSEIEKLLVSESEKALYKNDNNKWIITDVRFENEAQAIKDRGGIVIRVERPIYKIFDVTGSREDILIPFVKEYKREPTKEELNSLRIGEDGKYIEGKEHPSETALDDYEFDHVIENDGSLDELIGKIKQLNLI